jgi:hypothetical protein
VSTLVTCKNIFSHKNIIFNPAQSFHEPQMSLFHGKGKLIYFQTIHKKTILYRIFSIIFFPSALVNAVDGPANYSLVAFFS